MLDVEDVAGLWQVWADALSGRDNPMTGTPIKGEHWMRPPATMQPIPTIARTGGYVVVSMTDYGGTSWSARAPYPLTNQVDILAAEMDGRFRRAIVQSRQSDVVVGDRPRTWYPWMTRQFRRDFLDACWPGKRLQSTDNYDNIIIGDHSTFPAPAPYLLIQLQVTQSWLWAPILTWSWADADYGPFGVRSEPMFFSENQRAVYDLCACLSFQVNYDNGYGGEQQVDGAPLDPDVAEDLASIIEYTGVGDAFSLPDIDALHHLAEQLAAGSENNRLQANAVVSRKNISAAPVMAAKTLGQPVALSKKLWTVSSALRRVAEGVTGAFGADFRIGTAGAHVVAPTKRIAVLRGPGE